jgi:hypothetical protein
MELVQKSRRFGVLFLLSTLLMTVTATLPVRTSLVLAQRPPQQLETPVGTIIVPPSSVENPVDIGVRAHTNHLIWARPQKPTCNRLTDSAAEPGFL